MMAAEYQQGQCTVIDGLLDGITFSQMSEQPDKTLKPVPNDLGYDPVLSVIVIFENSAHK